MCVGGATDNGQRSIGGIMLRAGLAYSLCFLAAHGCRPRADHTAGSLCAAGVKGFVTAGGVIDDIFGLSYTHKEIAAFVLATIIAFPLGDSFPYVFKVDRW